MVWKLVVSCRWNCDLSKPSTILEMKTLRRELYTQLPRMLISTNPSVQCTSFFIFSHPSLITSEEPTNLVFNICLHSVH
jgi:hypothetical protein